MSELLRYEELIKQQLSDLPLPDENFAWAEMKKLLDEEDEDGVVVLPLKWGCGPGALFLGLLITGACWFFIRPEKWFHTLFSKNKETVVNNTPHKGPTKSRNETVTIKSDSLKSNGSGNNSDSAASPIPSYKPDATTSGNSPVNDNETSRARNKKISVARKENRVFTQMEKKIISNVKKNKPRKRNRIINRKKDSKKVNEKLPDNQAATEKTPNSKFKNSIINPDSPVREQNAATTDLDSIVNTITKKDSLSIADTTSKTKKTKAISYSWGSGLAVYQQLPFDGQKAVPYNSLGREGSLMDYIPAVYLRFYKDKKWFLQSEFRYGAPQYTKDIIYDIKKNTGPSGNIDSAFKVKKTYYHQLPVSFNYYIVPGLSIGTGFVFNQFKSAISQQEVFKTFSSGQPDSTISSTIVKASNKNSVFSKSYFQLLAETQYSWKRLTIGARYARGLQPYIKFQLPGEPLKEEKNSSLQVFVRYELWKSKPKGLKEKKR